MLTEQSESPGDSSSNWRSLAFFISVDQWLTPISSREVVRRVRFDICVLLMLVGVTVMLFSLAPPTAISAALVVCWAIGIFTVLKANVIVRFSKVDQQKLYVLKEGKFGVTEILRPLYRSQGFLLNGQVEAAEAASVRRAVIREHKATEEYWKSTTSDSPAQIASPENKQ